MRHPCLTTASNLDHRLTRYRTVVKGLTTILYRIYLFSISETNRVASAPSAIIGTALVDCGYVVRHGDVCILGNHAARGADGSWRWIDATSIHDRDNP